MKAILAIVMATAALLSARPSRADCPVDRAKQLGCSQECARTGNCSNAECRRIQQQCTAYINSHKGTRCGEYCAKSRDSFSAYGVCYQQCSGQKITPPAGKPAARGCEVDRARLLGCSQECAKTGNCSNPECAGIQQACKGLIDSQKGTRCGDYCAKSRDSFGAYLTCHQQCSGQKVTPPAAKSVGTCEVARAKQLGCSQECAKTGNCSNAECSRIQQACTALIQSQKGTRCGDFCAKSRDSFSAYMTCHQQCSSGPAPKAKR